MAQPNMDANLGRIVTAGIMPAIRIQIDLAECGKKTVDSAAAEIRQLLNAYDKFYQTGRTT